LSNPSAIATVTATLQNLLTAVTTSVTTKPPASAREGSTGDQLNVFLYSIHHNPAFRNAPMPHQSRDGERSHPPLALVLKYMVTAYGQNDDDVSGQELMGEAMSLLHDHPLLGPSDIEGITPESSLQNQVERVRITPESLSLDDMSKLWSSFQSAEYHLSVTYEVSVVLIESDRPARTPLPVLRRGEDDRGAYVQTGLVPPFPAITAVEPPNGQPAAVLGDTLDLGGHHLAGDTVTVRFGHPLLASPIELPALAGGTDSKVSVQIPNDPAAWVAGIHSIEVIVAIAGEQDRTTNTLSVSIAPRILTIAPPSPVATVGGDVTLTLTFSPELRPQQRAALLLGDREVLAGDHPAPTDTLAFAVTDAPLGDRYIRLRFDGVDSLLVDRSVTPPVFDSSAQVTIT
jgi:hypothetical protein